MTRYPPERFLTEQHVNYKFGILAATAVYGPDLNCSRGRPLLVRAKKADALARALPEPERTAVADAFARFYDLQAALHDAHWREQ